MAGAVLEANTRALLSERGPSPNEAWASRSLITASERDRFIMCVDRQRKRARTCNHRIDRVKKTAPENAPNGYVSKGYYRLDTFCVQTHRLHGNVWIRGIPLLTVE